MFITEFKNNFPFLSKFYEAAISDNASKMSHAYILTGSDSMAQYYAAIQTAKVLNCKTKLPDCKCINCQWINQNRHPAVITVSPVDFTYTAEGAKATSATVIKVDQARYLRKILATSSPYQRVIIFTDAADSADSHNKAELMWQHYRELLSPPPIESNETRENWIPSGMNAKMFQSETANTLLKTVEEPNPGVTFFFLVKDREDMIDTIVSRCQVLPVPVLGKICPDYSKLKEILNHLPPKNPLSALHLTERILEISKTESIPPEEILNAIQEYFRHIIHSNISDQRLVNIMITGISKAEKAKKELNSYIAPQTVLESFILSI